MKDALALTLWQGHAVYPGESTEGFAWMFLDAAGEPVSWLWMDEDTHEILDVWTEDDLRGQGLASRLYQIAASQTEIFHAPPWHRTPDGDAFAARVGGPELDSYDCCNFDSDWDD